MGAPKQKWTSEEEAALKAGVVKHGAGKWRTILMDPEFSSILHLRSNVDLKDKWRNMNVMASGLGSRHRAKLALKNQIIPKDHEAMALSTVVRSGEEIIDAKPLAISRGPLRIDGSKKAISRLDNRILEAITNLKDPSGSNKTDIASYIEKQYWTPPNFKKLLSSKLKFLAGNGKLIKVKGNYWIAPSLTSPVVRRNSAPSLISPVVRRNSSMPFTEGKQKDSPKADNSDIKSLSKSQIDADLVKMRSMTAQEAAMAAARAVAEAEAAIAEAEEAAREAEEAEAEAEAAHVFAEAAFKALKCRILQTW